MRYDEKTEERLDELLDGIDARLEVVESAIVRSRSSVISDTTGERGLDSASPTHVVFVPSASGYALVERSGAAPVVGTTLELPGLKERYRVVRSVRSSAPGERRPCVYVEIV